jgi:3-(3-hydroxy-phenyl)propionate hydroxylase
MLKTYTYPRYAYRRPDGAGPGAATQYPVVVVGAGPVGLAVAIDLAQSGVPVVLLDDDDTVSVGSRGVCYAKRTLEILDRLGVGDAVTGKGVTWNVGRTFFHDHEVYRFNLLPDPQHRRPGMVNLQQYYLEQFLVERAAALGVQLCWKNKVVAVVAHDDGVALRVAAPDGGYEIDAAWLVAADGARSPIRRMLGLDVEGKVFQDRFLIADVVMKADFPPERWFWFDPPFHPNQSALLHRQADDVWRIDFQLGWNVDPEEEKRPEKVIPRIRAMLGDREFELEWVSVYTFQCRRMNRFRHGRVLFAGDAAHQVSPFGARGANSGIQDADNLAWKLKRVLDGASGDRLLDTYSGERLFAADENILNSTRSTDFITPKSAASRTMRDAVLQLAARHPFARKLVNSGRLSVPAVLTGSPLNTPDRDPFDAGLMPGAPMEDAPVEADGRRGWLLGQLGNRFQLLVYVDRAGGPEGATLDSLARETGIEAIVVAQDPPAGDRRGVLHDVDGVVARRLDARAATTYLLRPDQHVAARWRSLDAAAVRAALARATCH